MLETTSGRGQSVTTCSTVKHDNILIIWVLPLSLCFRRWGEFRRQLVAGAGERGNPLIEPKLALVKAGPDLW